MIWMSMKKVSEYDLVVPQSQTADQPNREEEPQNTKSHKTSMERYVHYRDLTRSGNTIKQQPSGLYTWIL